MSGRHPTRAIQKLFAEGLSPAREEKLRAHLRTCGACRDAYDAQALLFRALGGDVDVATVDEDRRMLDRARHELGLADAPTTASGWRALFGLEPRAVTLSAVGAAGLAGAAVAVFFLLGEPAVVGTVARAYGASLDDHVLLKDQPVRAGESIGTARSGVAEVTLRRGGHVRVFPDTKVRFSDAGADVVSGGAWFDVEPGKSPYAVRTPEGTAQVDDGSVVVERIQGATQVRVVKGEARVRGTATDGAVQVFARQQTSVKAGARPSVPHAYSPKSDRDRWLTLLKTFLGDIGQAIRDGMNTIRDALEGK